MRINSLYRAKHLRGMQQRVGHRKMTDRSKKDILTDVEGRFGEMVGQLVTFSTRPTPPDPGLRAGMAAPTIGNTWGVHGPSASTVKHCLYIYRQETSSSESIYWPCLILLSRLGFELLLHDKTRTFLLLFSKASVGIMILVAL